MKPAKIALIPIDSRPITYSFPQQVAACAGLDAIAPPLEMMGNLEVPADCDALFVWLEECLRQFKPDALVVCLDSILYGGLVASRCSLNSFAEIRKRVDKISRWKTLCGGKTQIFAQSSIMRIPHYNTSKTEPPYWMKHGEQIFNWSVLKHKQETTSVDTEISLLESQIPKDAIADFLRRRERNFRINQSLIEMAVARELDYLVLSQDDTSEYGLNVLEKTRLVSQAKALGAENVIAYAGTDETISVLLARWLIERSAMTPRFSFIFSPPQGVSVLSKFEGQAIGESVSAVSSLTGLGVLPEEPRSGNDDDVRVIIHCPTDSQGDHLGTQSAQRLDTADAVRATTELLDESQIPVVLCDVAYSNGADPLLIESLLERPQLLKKLCGFAGWNTTNNTVGSALAMGISWWYSQLNGLDRDEEFKKALFVRFADDWAYQSVVRRQLNGQTSDASLNKNMAPFLAELMKALGVNLNPVILRLPWKRTFEVEVDLQESAKTANIGPER